MVFVLTNDQVVDSALRSAVEATEALGKAVQALGQIQRDLDVLRRAAKEADEHDTEENKGFATVISKTEAR